jgi:hypothetical protein
LRVSEGLGRGCEIMGRVGVWSGLVEKETFTACLVKGVCCVLAGESRCKYPKMIIVPPTRYASLQVRDDVSSSGIGAEVFQGLNGISAEVHQRNQKQLGPASRRIHRPPLSHRGDAPWLQHQQEIRDWPHVP